jgi:histidyl-tRNA synthetase
MLLPEAGVPPRCDVFVMPLSADSLDAGVVLQHALRASGVAVLMDQEGKGLRSQMKKADKLGARFAVLRGDDEKARGVWTVRDMGASSQDDVPEDKVRDHLLERLRG